MKEREVINDDFPTEWCAWISWSLRWVICLHEIQGIRPHRLLLSGFPAAFLFLVCLPLCFCLSPLSLFGTFPPPSFSLSKTLAFWVYTFVRECVIKKETRNTSRNHKMRSRWRIVAMTSYGWRARGSRPLQDQKSRHNYSQTGSAINSQPAPQLPQGIAIEMQ